MEIEQALLLCCSIISLLIVAIYCTGRLLYTLWWRPLIIKKKLELQGLKSPPFKLLVGNLKEVEQLYQSAGSITMSADAPHDMAEKVLPEFHKWRNEFKKTSFYFFRHTPRLIIAEPALIKQIFSCDATIGHITKYPLSNPVKRLIGANGLSSAEGLRWAGHRRILNFAFHTDVLKKTLVPVVQATTSRMMDSWRRDVAEGKEIEVLEEFRKLTADVIAAASFGSSYEEGKHVFDLQVEQAAVAAKAARRFSIPFGRYVPTADNIRAWRTEREITRSLERMVKLRIAERSRSSDSTEGVDDLLSIMTRNIKDSAECISSFTMADIVDNCKTFYFAGHETSSVLLTWCVVLLGMYPKWQQRCREEVVRECGWEQPPRAETLPRLKIVNMVVQEVLRLYPPVPALARRICKDVTVGGLTIPEGVDVLVPALLVHHDEDVWGKDAKEFNPWRWDAAAAVPSASFVAFGWGPRICVGMTFALIEAKIALSLIIQRFSFSLSPAYVHAPHGVVSVRPQHGAQVIFQRLQS